MTDSWLLKLTKFGLALTILTPLVSSSRFMYPLIFPRVVYFRIVVELTALAFTLAALTTPKLVPRFRAPILTALMIFTGTQIIAALLGVNLYQSFASSISRSDGVITLLHLVAFCVIASTVLTTPRAWRPYLYMAVALLAFEAMFGLGQSLNLPLLPRFGNSRPVGTTGNPSFLATLMIFGIWLPLWLASLQDAGGHANAMRGKRWHWIVATLIALLCGLNLWLTQIRGAIFAVLISGSVLLLLIARRSRSHGQRVLAGGTLGGLALAVLVVIFSRGTPLVTWNETLSRLAQTSLSAVTVENRLISWGIALKGFSARPIFGWGSENFGVVYDRYFNPALVRDFGSFSWYDRAHNGIAETLVGSGALGLVGSLLLLGAIGLAVWEISRRTSMRRPTTLLVAMLTSYAIAMLTTFDTINSAVLVFMLLAYLASAADPAFSVAAPRPRQSESRRRLRFGPAAIVIALMAVLCATVNVTPSLAVVAASRLALDADRSLPQVERDFRYAFSISPPQRQEFRQLLGNFVLEKIGSRPPLPPQTIDPLVNLALNELSRSTAADPDNLQTQLILSELARQLTTGNPALLNVAQQAAQAVVARAPARYHGYFAVGRIAMTAGRSADGIAAFREVTVRYPGLSAGHWNLAIAYVLDGNPALAKQSLERTRRLDPTLAWAPDNIEKLGRAYVDRGFLEDAVALYRQAVERAPKNAEYYRQLAHLYQQLGRTAEAKTAAAAAITINPVLGAEFSALNPSPE
ncbi:MAG: O-antigen ligase family protein [Patescibacteria group bacterium]|nr:O-antigen ligase family protein [Patescibacteria group bacterium]